MSDVPVPITLAAPDLYALEIAQTALLSPLEYRNTDTWRVAASTRIAQLIGADNADFTPPRSSGVWSRRLGVPRRVPLYHAWRGRSEIFVDWLRTGQLFDTVSASSEQDTESMQTSLRDTDIRVHQEPGAGNSIETFGEREVAFLRLLLPAFRAGVRTHIAFVVQREALARMFDRLADGAAVWDRSGNWRYRNRALDDLLAADTERATLERRLVDLARAVTKRGAKRPAAAAEASDVTWVTAANQYRVQTTYAAGLGARGPWVLVLVRPARRLPSALSLQSRYGLTPRQSEVARRLAEGESNVAIARALGISRRTAEHHAEAVLLTLGVHSRSALAAALQQHI